MNEVMNNSTQSPVYTDDTNETSEPLAATLSILILTILVLVQGVGGTISNALSLSYFLKKDRETLAGKLMILLNSIDLLVCFSALLVLIVFSIYLPSHYQFLLLL